MSRCPELVEGAENGSNVGLVEHVLSVVEGTGKRYEFFGSEMRKKVPDTNSFRTPLIILLGRYEREIRRRMSLNNSVDV